MHKIGLVMAALLCCAITYGQYNIAIKASDADNKQPLAGATISIIVLQKNTTADSAGTGQFKNLAACKYSVLISYVGYAAKKMYP